MEFGSLSPRGGEPMDFPDCEASLSYGLFSGKRYLFSKMHRIVLGEKNSSDMKYPVSDKKSRKNIDGIVQMAQKNGCPEKKGRSKEYFSQPFVFPIYETHEKG